MIRQIVHYAGKMTVLVCLAAAGIVPVARAQHLGAYAEADADHDGKVTFAEFATYEIARAQRAAGPGARHFRSLTQEQQATRLHAKFDSLDQGHKHYLTWNDWPVS